MVKVRNMFIGLLAAVVLVPSIAAAQGLTMNLGSQTASAAGATQFQFQYEGPANAFAVTFYLAYDAAAQAVFTAASPISCTRDPNIAFAVGVTATLQATRNRIRIAVLGLGVSVITPFGITSGVLASCTFNAVASGPVKCDANATPNAAGVEADGTTVFEITPVNCVDGSLTVAGGPGASPTPTRTATPTPTPPPCPGDCDGGGIVTVDEILRMVNIALGNAAISDCMLGDDGQITVDEILAAVINALNGCP